MRTDDQPRALLGEQQNAAIFTASPYHRPVVGWMSDLDAMTPADARAFFQRWYVPANAAIVVAGDVDVEQVRALAEKYYGSHPGPRRARAQAAHRAGAARRAPRRVQGAGRAGLRVAGLPRAADRDRRRLRRRGGQRRLGAGGAGGRARRLSRRPARPRPDARPRPRGRFGRRLRRLRRPRAAALRPRRRAGRRQDARGGRGGAARRGRQGGARRRRRGRTGARQDPVGGQRDLQARLGDGPGARARQQLGAGPAAGRQRADHRAGCRRSRPSRCRRWRRSTSATTR